MAGPERPNHFTVLPQHQVGQTLTSSSSHFPVNYFNNSQSLIAYYTLTSFATSSSHTSYKAPGYQYLSQLFYTIPRTFEDDQSLGDGLIVFWSKYFEEDYILNDYLFLGTAYNNDSQSFGDSLLITYIQALEEDFSMGDSLVRVISLEEESPLIDSLVLTWTKRFTEGLSAGDSVISAFPDGASYSLTIAIQEAPPPYYSLTISSEVYDLTNNTLDVGILPYNLPAVTSLTPYASTSNATPVVNISGYGVPVYASPVTAASANPFYPTVIVAGSTYASNIQTAPPPGYNITPQTFFVQWANSPIGGVGTCDILNFDIQLDYSGGTFFFSTVGDPGYNLGDSISVWGLNGTVTEKGPIYSNSQVGTVIKGIFGNRNLNKQLNMLGQGNPQVFAYLTNSLLVTQQENSLKTFAGAAEAIAGLAGCNLAWYLPDVPLVDFTVQEGETAISALSSIVNQFGGQLLWDGGNTYLALPPTQYIGFWVNPSQYLMAPAGMQSTNKLDISTGAFGTGFYGISVERFFDPRIYGLPSTIPQADFPQVQKVATNNKALTASDPLWIVDLPLDTEEAWIQILVNQNATSTTAKYVTSDASQWFSLGSPSISNSNVKLVNKGGALGAVVPQAQIGSNLFPNIDAVNNGNFIMSVGVTRNDNSALFEAAVASRDQQLRNLLTKLLGSFKYVATYDGSISTYFHGSIPKPGMYARASACGVQVEGVIQSVSFTYPGLINIQVSQFAEINFVSNFYYVDLLNPTGLGPAPPPSF